MWKQQKTIYVKIMESNLHASWFLSTEIEHRYINISRRKNQKLWPNTCARLNENYDQESAMPKYKIQSRCKKYQKVSKSFPNYWKFRKRIDGNFIHASKWLIEIRPAIFGANIYYIHCAMNWVILRAYLAQDVS